MKTIMARNFKLWNHWISEVRDIALKKKVKYEGENKPATRNQLKWTFCEMSMKSYFDEGMSPSAAFDEEVSNWN